MSTTRIWGRRPVLEALRARTVTSISIATGRDASGALAELLALASEQHVHLLEVSAAKIEEVAPGANTQGIVATVRTLVPVDLEELLDLETSTPAFLVAVDQIQDPQNLGALIRTAEAAGVQGLVLSDRRTSRLSGAVAKASAGALSHLPIAQVTNLVRGLDAARRRGLWTIGLDDSATSSLYDIDLTVPLLLVVGSESDGLRRLTRQHCDYLAKLPMRGEVASLNVSAAGAIAMYEVVRQRMATMGSP
jgi:23S rRNA (guanosine2251-2'-O)-methyltransferase